MACIVGISYFCFIYGRIWVIGSIDEQLTYLLLGRLSFLLVDKFFFIILPFFLTKIVMNVNFSHDDQVKKNS